MTATHPVLSILDNEQVRTAQQTHTHLNLGHQLHRVSGSAACAACTATRQRQSISQAVHGTAEHLEALEDDTAPRLPTIRRCRDAVTSPKRRRGLIFDNYELRAQSRELPAHGGKAVPQFLMHVVQRQKHWLNLTVDWDGSTSRRTRGASFVAATALGRQQASAARRRCSRRWQRRRGRRDVVRH